MFRDPISLLKFEHSVIRVRSGIILRTLECEEGWKLFEELHSFVVGWHARVEDLYVFPLLGEESKPFSNDHMLISKYGDAVLKERRRDWAERYIKILLDHNLNEELKLFKAKEVDPSVMEKIISNMTKYGPYENFTGIRLEDIRGVS
ncbi:hemerythrin domain-containing protein [Metallosphaera hakonensis]